MKKTFDVFLTRAAEDDFQTVWEYIAQENSSNAADFLDQIEAKIASLNASPDRCPLIPENNFFKDNRYRHLIHKDYRIVFTIRSNAVYVMRIFHGAKLIDIASFETN